MSSLPVGTTAPDHFIPPCPSWARAEVHERFWRVVGRAVDRAALPPSVWAVDPDDVGHDEEPAQAGEHGPDEERSSA